MSTQTKFNTNMKSINNAYCKVCQDAGKSEAVYRSHYTRESKDPNAKICCPTLLALECRYCFKAGHTVKYCKTLKENEKNKKRWEFQSNLKCKKEQEGGQPKQLTTNKFDYLIDEDDDDESVYEEVQKEKEEFPQLCAPKLCESGLNYAIALQKESEPVKVKKIVLVKKYNNNNNNNNNDWNTLNNISDSSDDEGWF